MKNKKFRYWLIKQTTTYCTICDTTNNKQEAERWKRRWQKKFTAIAWDSKEKRSLII